MTAAEPTNAPRPTKPVTAAIPATAPRPRRSDGNGAPSVNIHIDKVVVDPALVPRSQAAAYRARLTARLRAMAADPALATVSSHELEARIAHHAREALKAVKSDG